MKKLDVTGTAANYHEKTSYRRSSMGGHELDWQNQPGVFKTYEGLKTLAMPDEGSFRSKDFHSLYAQGPEARTDQTGFDLELISKILFLTYTITSKAHSAGGNFYFRSAASAGALYPNEIYVLSRGVKNLENGLYHFCIPKHQLVKLREGDLSEPAGRAIGNAPSDEFPITLYFTVIYFRSAWKYRDRAYRYHLLDTGHVLENLDLSLKALGFSCEILFDFDDGAVNHLLGLDDEREVALALCRLKGKTESPDTPEIGNIKSLPQNVRQASRVSRYEFDMSEIRRIHEAGYGTGVHGTGPGMCDALGLRRNFPAAVPGSSKTDEALPYPEVVFSRRSARNFIKQKLPFSALGAFIRVLLSSGWGISDDYLKTVCSGFLANGVESLENGFYMLDPEVMEFSLVKPGNFAKTMSHICLDQAWMANASTHFLFMVDIASLDRLRGTRGYRYAMMAAGILGERLYLAATAMGFGCCGIGAFYDGEARQLLGLNETSRLLYLVSTGAVKSTSGKSQ